MPMTLELSMDDARCLYDHLTRHIVEIDHERVHTERHQMRRELAADSERLRQIKTRLGQLIEPAG